VNGRTLVRVFVRKRLKGWQRNPLGTATNKGTRMTKVRDLHKKWMKDPEYRKAHKALAPEFELAGALIQARVQASLTQNSLRRAWLGVPRLLDSRTPRLLLIP
jgi:hypothetical protein